jgi:hypothetical protein
VRTLEFFSEGDVVINHIDVGTALQTRVENLSDIEFTAAGKTLEPENVFHRKIGASGNGVGFNRS